MATVTGALRMLGSWVGWEGGLSVPQQHSRTGMPLHGKRQRSIQAFVDQVSSEDEDEPADKLLFVPQVGQLSSAELIVYNVPSVQQGKLFVNQTFPLWPIKRAKPDPTESNKQLVQNRAGHPAQPDGPSTSTPEKAAGQHSAARVADELPSIMCPSSSLESDVVSISDTPYASPQEGIPSRSPSPPINHSGQHGSSAGEDNKETATDDGKASCHSRATAFCWPLASSSARRAPSSGSGKATSSFTASGRQGHSRKGSHSPFKAPAQLPPLCPFHVGRSLSNLPAYVGMHEEANPRHRNYMEDRTAFAAADGVVYLAVYDGHGGSDASTFLQANLLRCIRDRLAPGADVADAMLSAYAETNAAFRCTGSIHGSTSTTVVLHGTQLVCANVGDSPAIVITHSGDVYCAFQEHRIDGEELARVRGHGVAVISNACGPTYMSSACGTRWLNMSRAFGDFMYPAVLCEPFVCSLDIRDARYLVIGSDGLTERWQLKDIALAVAEITACSHGGNGSGRSSAAPSPSASMDGNHSRFTHAAERSGGGGHGQDVFSGQQPQQRRRRGGAHQRMRPADIAKALVQRALGKGSTDNVSAMVLDFDGYFESISGLAHASSSSSSPASQPTSLSAGGVAGIAHLQPEGPAVQQACLSARHRHPRNPSQHEMRRASREVVERHACRQAKNDDDDEADGADDTKDACAWYSGHGRMQVHGSGSKAPKHDAHSSPKSSRSLESSEDDAYACSGDEQSNQAIVQTSNAVSARSAMLCSVQSAAARLRYEGHWWAEPPQLACMPAQHLSLFSDEVLSDSEAERAHNSQDRLLYDATHGSSMQDRGHGAYSAWDDGQGQSMSAAGGSSRPKSYSSSSSSSSRMMQSAAVELAVSDAGPAADEHSAAGLAMGSGMVELSALVCDAHNAVPTGRTIKSTPAGSMDDGHQQPLYNSSSCGSPSSMDELEEVQEEDEEAYTLSLDFTLAQTPYGSPCDPHGDISHPQQMEHGSPCHAAVADTNAHGVSVSPMHVPAWTTDAPGSPGSMLPLSCMLHGVDALVAASEALSAAAWSEGAVPLGEGAVIDNTSSSAAAASNACALAGSSKCGTSSTDAVPVQQEDLELCMAAVDMHGSPMECMDMHVSQGDGIALICTASDGMPMRVPASPLDGTPQTHGSPGDSPLPPTPAAGAGMQDAVPGTHGSVMQGVVAAAELEVLQPLQLAMGSCSTQDTKDAHAMSTDSASCGSAIGSGSMESKGMPGGVSMLLLPGAVLSALLPECGAVCMAGLRVHEASEAAARPQLVLQ